MVTLLTLCTNILFVQIYSLYKLKLWNKYLSLHIHFSSIFKSSYIHFQASRSKWHLFTFGANKLKNAGRSEKNKYQNKCCDIGYRFWGGYTFSPLVTFPPNFFLQKESNNCVFAQKASNFGSQK